MAKACASGRLLLNSSNLKYPLRMLRWLPFYFGTSWEQQQRSQPSGRLNGAFMSELFPKRRGNSGQGDSRVGARGAAAHLPD